MTAETVASYAGRWLRDHPRSKASTNKSHGHAVAPFAREFGGVKMAEITRQAARRWGLDNPSQVNALRTMFRDAIDDEILTKNPFSNLRLPQPQGRKDLVTLTAAEVSALADRALQLDERGSVLRAATIFAAHVGIRPGELYVLQWSDIDFANGEVQIRRGLGSTGEITSPKNSHARTVVLSPVAAQALREMPRRLDTEIVFPKPDGSHYTKSSFAYWWEKVRNLAGRPGMDFYELRHFCATYLLELGVSHADVAIQLGHRDGGALVMSTYGHPAEAGARSRLRQAMAGKRLGPDAVNGLREATAEEGGTGN